MAAPADFRCVDCGDDTYASGEYYMVHDWVLREEAGMAPLGGMLCIGCLEERIGRRLRPADFTDVPINLVISPAFSSARLVDRYYREAA
jgi:hypothetical protein